MSEIKPITPDELKEIMKNSFRVKMKKKIVNLELLDHSINNLRPITYLEDKTKMILVYLPTKVSSTVGKDDDAEEVIEFQNRAYMICSGKNKSIIPIDDDYLQKNFRIKILPEWIEARWNKDKIFQWRDSPEKLDVKLAFQTMMETIKDYLDFENESDYVYFALWNFHTYLYELFDATPYNDYTGTKRAGKSKAMEFQKLVCYNAIMSPDVTSSAFFRIVEGIGATTLLDETESMKNKRDEKAQGIRTLIMQGFLKDQYAIRSEGKADSGFTPTPYNLFSPTSLAHINALDDVLEDRCIQQLMRRSKNKKLLNKWLDKRKDLRFEKIRDFEYRLFLDYADEIDDLKDDAEGLLSISGRELLIWKPIITLALFFEKHGMPNLTKMIKTKSSTSSESRQIQDEEDSFDLRILKFLTEHALTISEVHDTKESSKNPKGWKPTKRMYESLLAYKEDYGIIEDYMTIHKFTEIVKRLGFKRAKKELGISWLVNDATIKDAQERMGLLETSSVSSVSSGSSGSCLQSTLKTEHPEHPEHPDGNTRHTITMNKTEHPEHPELVKKTTSSVSSGSSGLSNKE